MDLYPFAAGPIANMLGFLKAVILALLIIVWLMIIMAFLPVVKTVNSYSDSNNIVSGQANNSSVANHSTASINDNSTNNNISCDISHTSNVNSSKDFNNVTSNSNSSDAINNCSDNSNNDTYNVTSCAANCGGVNNDISRGDNISNCVVSDNTTDITDNGNDIGNSNNSNDKNIVVDNASSSHGNNRNIISDIAVVQFLLISRTVIPGSGCSATHFPVVLNALLPFIF